MATSRVLSYPGAKWKLAEWIISYMPKHTTYLEPYFGSGAVLFNKDSSKLETVNDMDGEVVNLFTVIRDQPEELARKIQWTPFARDEYYLSYESCDEPIERARRFLVRCWMARGRKTSDRTGWASIMEYDKRPASPTKYWNRLPDDLQGVAERLKHVQIENQLALQVIERYRFKDVLIYADPPYVMRSRSSRMYKHEMKEADHIAMLDALELHPGPVLLSGYPDPLYDDRLGHWKRETKQSNTDHGSDRTEVLWINPTAARQLGGQISLFD